jgi:neural Wiskott-Aldrich syndrome protein
MARNALVPPMGPPGTAPSGKVGAGKRKGKPAVPRMKGGAPPPPPPPPVRGRVPSAPASTPRRMGPPPPRNGAPARMTPPPAGAERLEGATAPPPSTRAAAMPQGRAQTMAALRRGRVAF